ncbi:fumarylacetoacetate hydrolase family protein, partial [Siminovitchia fortis]|uniref:fumarylacetoacetate hydrolase family protein n=1 Tax=Siminovitchia fortis TaxID=254758 RepID=UPI003704CD74
MLNHLTPRHLQRTHKQFFIRKTLDTTSPIPPSILHHSQIHNPNQLPIHTKLNPQLTHHSNTKHFIFPTQQIIPTF